MIELWKFGLLYIVCFLPASIVALSLFLKGGRGDHLDDSDEQH